LAFETNFFRIVWNAVIRPKLRLTLVYGLTMGECMVRVLSRSFALLFFVLLTKIAPGTE